MSTKIAADTLLEKSIDRRAIGAVRTWTTDTFPVVQVGYRRRCRPAVGNLPI
ncbi:MAG: hypothetical protein FWE95_09675 [Planctomycetaceae bacterium]|nr:hypothetical protein [Planctomycetaceae bacterium]